MTQVKPSELAVKIASTCMNSCPGIMRSDSSVPSGHMDDTGGKSGICCASRQRAVRSECGVQRRLTFRTLNLVYPCPPLPR